LIGVIVGLVWGFLALQGAIGLVGFAAINAGLVIVKLLKLLTVNYNCGLLAH
jgi:hypothetical protein